MMLLNLVIVFQSTPPARGATSFLSAMEEIVDISIHAPREGGDSNLLRQNT